MYNQNSKYIIMHKYSYVYLLNEPLTIILFQLLYFKLIFIFFNTNPDKSELASNKIYFISSVP